MEECVPRKSTLRIAIYLSLTNHKALNACPPISNSLFLIPLIDKALSKPIKPTYTSSTSNPPASTASPKFPPATAYLSIPTHISSTSLPTLQSNSRPTNPTHTHQSHSTGNLPTQWQPPNPPPAAVAPARAASVPPKQPAAVASARLWIVIARRRRRKISLWGRDVAVVSFPPRLPTPCVVCFLEGSLESEREWVMRIRWLMHR